MQLFGDRLRRDGHPLIARVTRCAAALGAAHLPNSGSQRLPRAMLPQPVALPPRPAGVHSPPAIGRRKPAVAPAPLSDRRKDEVPRPTAARSRPADMPGKYAQAAIWLLAKHPYRWRILREDPSLAGDDSKRSCRSRPRSRIASLKRGRATGQRRSASDDRKVPPNPRLAGIGLGLGFNRACRSEQSARSTLVPASPQRLSRS
jgi:hypothetical protein